MLPSDHWACFRPLGAVKGRWPYTRACFGRDLAKTNVTALAVACLIEEYGDAPMPGLLPELTGCPKWKSVGVYDRCKAIYDRQDG